jgi:hypothetical protein
MTRSFRLYTIAAAALIAATPATAIAQTTDVASATARSADTTATAADERRDSLAARRKAPTEPAAPSLNRTIELQHVRPSDQRGLNVFEAPKYDEVPFTGIKLVWGGAFTQQFQGISHSNSAAPRLVAGVDQNQLIGIGHGFNNAVANLNLGVQLAPGIRIAMTTYASARHHQETWIKDGYFLMDASPIDQPILNMLMDILTIRVGHFEVNYGDQHFRRTDNGNAIHNPFVGNLLMDAFTTEIGAEVYARLGGLMAMGGVTGGEIHGQVTAPEKRAPSYLGKLGFDEQLNEKLRVRLTGSMYTTKHSASNTLYSGDRAGSRYYDVLENVSSTESAQAWSGNVRPGMSDNITAFVINPFVKYGGIEVFGNFERAKGKAAAEAEDRTWRQYAGEVVYRFLPNEKLYVGSRYNVARGDLAGIANSVSVNRTQLAAGWFVTPSLLTKVEWVSQKYNDFPTTDIRNGGRFSGFVMEGVVAF